MDLYSEIILDHYKNPRNKGVLNGANASSKDNNPLCGDKICFYLKTDKGMIRDARFDGAGCAISQAAASMLAEILPGRKVSEVKKWDKEKVLEMLKVDLTPARIKCALLGLHVLHQALESPADANSRKDAEAGLAKPKADPESARITDARSFTEKNPYYKIINKIIDPETQIGLADMGLIYGAKKNGSKIMVTMTLTSMGCPAGPQFIDDIEYLLKKQKGVKEVTVEVVWEPMWTPDRIKPEIRAVLGL